MAFRSYALLILAALSFAPAALTAAEKTSHPATKKSAAIPTATKKPVAASAKTAAKTAKAKTIAKRAPAGVATPEEAESDDIAPIVRSGVTHAPGDAVAAVADFGRLLDKVEEGDRIAGLAVAVVKDDKVLLQRGIGYADAKAGLKVTPDTVFRLASLSKAFASAMAAILIDEGAFSWDTTVASVVPAFELMDADASSKLTVREVLSQRVGLPHNTYDRMIEADEPYPLLVDRLREVPMTCDVGECYGYQNVTYSLIGDVIYATTGDFFTHQVEKRLFRPLGMTTASYGREALEASASWARPHARGRGGWLPFENKDGYYHVAPAAGINASIRDMTQWLIAQMGGRPDVLSADELQTLHTPQVDTPHERRVAPWRRARVSDSQYALGWRVFDYAGETLVFHAGYVKGYHSMIAFLPKARFGTVMLWNCETALPSGLLPMLLDRYLGLPEVDWAGLDAPPSAPRRARIVATRKR
ncbi:MAG: serine hydrolase domain-containing protein [Rudaea sp.]|uniref:serine hydrolase domain-containing protein n=1 Tax=Rudaea sp. TaxID=2136325 RepID=UPI0039E6C969